MNTVYCEKTNFHPAIDSFYVSKEYYDHANKIANCISTLNETLQQINHLDEITKDNADVSYELKNALTYLGISLAVCINYASEYKAEAESDNEIDNENESNDNLHNTMN